MANLRTTGVRPGMMKAAVGGQREVGFWGGVKHYVGGVLGVIPGLRIGWEWGKTAKDFAALHLRRAEAAGAAASREFSLEVANTREAKKALKDLNYLLKKESLDEAELGEIFRRAHRALLYVNTKRPAVFISQIKELITVFEQLETLAATEGKVGRKLQKVSQGVEEDSVLVVKDINVMEADLLDMLKTSSGELGDVARDPAHAKHAALKTKLIEYATAAKAKESAVTRWTAEQKAIAAKISARATECNTVSHQAVVYLGKIEEIMQERVEEYEERQIMRILNVVRSNMQEVLKLIEQTREFDTKLKDLEDEIELVETSTFNHLKELFLLEGQIGAVAGL